ncbi:MAG: hypothetical protein M9894_10255 [Planctomycetes bacterium]|nr:hypothetical protein [Planctomycetota bacterium]
MSALHAILTPVGTSGDVHPDNITRVARLGAGAWSDLAGGGRRLAERLGPLLSSSAVAAACAGLRARIDGRASIAAACDAVEAAGRAAS